MAPGMAAGLAAGRLGTAGGQLGGGRSGRNGMDRWRRTVPIGTGGNHQGNPPIQLLRDSDTCILSSGVQTRISQCYVLAGTIAINRQRMPLPSFDFESSRIEGLGTVALTDFYQTWNQPESLSGKAEVVTTRWSRRIAGREQPTLPASAARTLVTL